MDILRIFQTEKGEGVCTGQDATLSLVRPGAPATSALLFCHVNLTGQIDLSLADTITQHKADYHGLGLEKRKGLSHAGEMGGFPISP